MDTTKSNGHPKSRPLSFKEVDDQAGVITDYVDLKQLPEFNQLYNEVAEVIEKSSWWDKYGVDWCIHILSLIFWVASHYMLASSNPFMFALGIWVLGYCNAVLAIKLGHCAVHKSASSSPMVNRILGFFASDFIGTFSSDAGHSIHIKIHHPYTNIIGLGDSSTWKSPILMPASVYMFLAPLLTPILIPFVAFKEVWELTMSKLVRHLVIAYTGLAFHIYLLMSISHLSLTSAFLVVFVSRNVLSIPYIHVNIFQHIGLPMYSRQHRPKKIYQMTTGVLNLPRNPILDFSFGHGIVSCHVAHHLFPRLSDNMCLKVEPYVRKFCKEHDLPYHYDTYSGRTRLFLSDYHRLMVNAPPITKFVGLQ